MNKTTEKLKQIKDEVIECQRCALYKTRTLPVVGQGSHWAKAMFIGEAPGANEDRTGIPFCGSAGKILDELFNLIGCKREDAYICNILKCRPPNNRDPLPEEKTACVHYLKKQIEAVKPKVICPMGNHATTFLLAEFGLSNEITGISKIHGKVFEAKASFGRLKIIPLYHPAVVVYNANTKDVLKKDFGILKKFLKK